jgi:hypothetical protein
MPGAVEPIQRIPLPTAEQRLDLDRLARRQKPEEATECLDIPAPSGVRHPRFTSAAITRSCSVMPHAGLSAIAKNRSSTLVPLPIVI